MGGQHIKHKIFLKLMLRSNLIMIRTCIRSPVFNTTSKNEPPFPTPRVKQNRYFCFAYMYIQNHVFSSHFQRPSHASMHQSADHAMNIEQILQRFTGIHLIVGSSTLCINIYIFPMKKYYIDTCTPIFSLVKLKPV